MKFVIRCYSVFLLILLCYTKCYISIPITVDSKCSLDLENSQNAIGVQQEYYSHSRRFKRSESNLRIHAFYDDSFNLQSHSYLYREFIIEPAINYLQKVLKVRNPYINIKLQRKCLTNRLAFVKFGTIFSYYCADGCAAVTMCGDVEVPNDHLMACRRILNSQLVKVGYEGPGVDDTDFILYIESKETKKCQDPSVLAYASSCQSEAELDRPIAGSINFCPGRLSSEFGHLSQSLFIAKHELLHALGFAVTQFAFYRDPYGEPYTPRSKLTGRPDLGFIAEKSGIYRWSDRVTIVDARLWQSAVGVFPKNVTLMVLPTVVEEAKLHFNCSSLIGVELEDQGGLGVSITHWEKRILENDIMTATFTQEARVSRITLALLYDTGWYIPNYELADHMSWGRNLGCQFLDMSCYEYMKYKELRGLDVEPFCKLINDPEKELAGFCSADKHAYGYCNLERYHHKLDPRYQYFTDYDIYDSAYYGGKSTVANYCPYPQEFNWYKGSKVSRTTQCTEARNNQGIKKNLLLQDFGINSSCFTLSKRWIVNSCGKKSVPSVIGAGCYKYFCSENFGLMIVINNQTYQCPTAGDIIAIEDSNKYFLISGALICPACTDLCPITHCRENPRLLPFVRSHSINNLSFQHCQSGLRLNFEIMLFFFNLLFFAVINLSDFFH